MPFARSPSIEEEAHGASRDKHLNAKAWVKLAVLAIVMSLLLFVPAGTVRYWQAWVYLSIFFGASAITTLYLIRKDPALLERRLSSGPRAEKRPTQKHIMAWTSLGFVALLVVPALDYRYGWSTVPLPGILTGDILVTIGMYFIFHVYRENTFTSATIEVALDQRVISSGPYRVVRHPMYASSLLYLAGTPLALGSCWGLVPIAFMLPFLVWRLFDEERFLAQNLPGYVEYQRTVRHRLIPGMW
jgi:protein-S-isoprenylcysteine O-methyltransferase Ste14